MCKILIVDDELDVRQTLKGILTDAKYVVHEAANEGEAMAIVIEEEFDFALIDVRLHNGGEEDTTGISLALAINKLKPQIRLILFTRYITAKQIIRAMRYQGVISFIEKTPDMDREILETLEEECKKGKQSRLERTGKTTQLSLSLSIGQSLIVRTQGYYVCSGRTAKILQVPIERYARKTEIAKKGLEDLRFQIKDIGLSLWKDILGEHNEIKEAYLGARAKSELVSLLFEASTEFLRLPLEFMRQEEASEYVVLQHPMARFICGIPPKREPISPQRLALIKKLRILIIASNTHSERLPLIPGVDVETQTLSAYLEQEQRYIPVKVKFIPTERATYNQVKKELQKSDYDIIHYAGHGWYDVYSPEESCLYFWSKKDKQGEVVPMKATELKMLLDTSTAHMVYLSCCYGTATADTSTQLNDDFLGLADAVVKAGIPSVLGFRWPVSDHGASKLSQAFYRSLLEQGSPSMALLTARRELAVDKDDPAWLSPILIHQE